MQITKLYQKIEESCACSETSFYYGKLELTYLCGLIKI